MSSFLLTNPYEKLLLRKAKNTDLKRGSLWLANIVFTSMGPDIVENEKLNHVLEAFEYYGKYTESEDPKELLIAESELSRMLALAAESEHAEQDESSFLSPR